MTGGELEGEWLEVGLYDFFNRVVLGLGCGESLCFVDFIRDKIICLVFDGRIFCLLREFSLEI